MYGGYKTWKIFVREHVLRDSFDSKKRKHQRHEIMQYDSGLQLATYVSEMVRFFSPMNMFVGEKFEDSNLVKITGCDVPPCKLKRRTKAAVEQKFVPSEDVENVVNSVSAAVVGVPLPFIGVDGTSACDNIFKVDGTPAGCSLKKGVEYIYKREFPVLQIYPTVSADVNTV